MITDRFKLLVFFILAIYGCSSNSLKENKVDKDIVSKMGFELMNFQHTGIEFINKITESPQLNIITYEYFHNGSGVALGDINNDGLDDIYFASTVQQDRIYLNKGDLKFEDITTGSGIEESLAGFSNGVLASDFNEDGLVDFYVCKSGNFENKYRENKLYINNGDLTFSESAQKFGLNEAGYSVHSALIDYDKDGDLDLFITNHNIGRPMSLPYEIFRNSVNELSGDKLYRNDNGSYTDVSKAAGIIQNHIGYGLGIAVSDINNDKWPDIYVTNDYLEHDYLYMNNGDGTFSEKIKELTGHISNFGMGCDIADMNNDGLMDIFVADMASENNYRQKANMSGMSAEKFWQSVNGGFHLQYMYNTLQLNNGEGQFSEVAEVFGAAKTDWSWAPLWADFDLDLNTDLFVTNGYRKDSRNNDWIKQKKLLIEQGKTIESHPNEYRDLILNAPAQKLSNYMLQNNGDFTSVNVAKSWGMDQQSFSNGAVYGDLDNDGDLDIVVNNIDDLAFVYRNNAVDNQAGNFVKIKLKGPKENRSGIGAKISLIDANGKLIKLKEQYVSRGYLSSVSYDLVFGVGELDFIPKIIVEWPNGAIEIEENVETNSFIEFNVVNSVKEPFSKELKSKIFTSFQSDGLVYEHIENEFDDFENEVLLPHRMSTLGPCVAVGDVNNDDLDDLYIGASYGEKGALFIQTKAGFTKNILDIKDGSKYEDIDATFIDIDNDGDLDIFLACGSNESKHDLTIYQDRIYINNGKGDFVFEKERLPAMAISSGCVKSCDYDDDGDLDLFVGGRQSPQNYPWPVSSFLLQNIDGFYTVAKEFKDVGMVTDACWADIDGDSKSELIMVGEWMPISIFKNVNGNFVLDADMIEHYSGWWNTIESSDIDGDGDVDIIVGNLGLNSKYKASKKFPFSVYSKDFDSNGTNDIVLSYYNSGKMFPVRGRQCSSEQIPELKQKFPSYHEFASSDIEQIYGPNMEGSLVYEANEFKSLMLINENGRLSSLPLPTTAQFSQVNSILINDFDGDGMQEVILAGNNYHREVETTRSDASIGVFLDRDSLGSFNSISLENTGFLANGDVRHIEEMKINGQKMLLIVRNNDSISLLKY